MEFAVARLSIAGLLLGLSAAVLADDEELKHHLSYGPLASEDYYWVRTGSSTNFDLELQEKALKHLEVCRLFQKMKHGEAVLELSMAEEEIRVCMLKEGWKRIWNNPQIIITHHMENPICRG